MRYLVCDVETTGLDAHKDALLEIACILLDEQYREIDAKQFVIRHSGRRRSFLMEHTDPYVLAMHTANGLWNDIDGERAVERKLVDGILAGWLLGNTEEGEQVRMIGNSLRLDLNFVEHHLPLTYECLSYRSMDVSAIEHFLTTNFEVEKFLGTGQPSNHRAMDDANTCLAQLLHYREALESFMFINTIIE